ncbi:MAG: hypothetical protein JSV46_10485 [Candidatus Aminicenantes bacterium]|nr:MAG: hypothetical protein JSV46_10485 [Candidatus Aminicenantes bacterium]
MSRTNFLKFQPFSLEIPQNRFQERPRPFDLERKPWIDKGVRFKQGALPADISLIGKCRRDALFRVSKLCTKDTNAFSFVVF